MFETIGDFFPCQDMGLGLVISSKAWNYNPNILGKGFDDVDKSVHMFTSMFMLLCDASSRDMSVTNRVTQ